MDKTFWVLFFLCNGNQVAGHNPGRVDCSNTPYEFTYINHLFYMKPGKSEEEACLDHGKELAKDWKWYFTGKLTYEPACFLATVKSQLND